MLRILHMVDSLGYQGLEAVVMNYYRNINRSKIQFDFIVTSSKPQRYNDEVKHLGGTVYKLPSRNRHLFKYIQQLRRVFLTNKYQIFHAHGNSASIAIDTLVAKLCGVKIVIGHSHNTNCLFKIQHYLLKPLLMFTLNYRFAGSQETAKWLFGNRKYHLFINGINLSNFSFNENLRDSLRDKYKLKNAQIFLHVGAYRESKNHSFIIDIFEAIYEKNSNSYLFLIGDGELKAIIDEKIRKSKCFRNIIQLGNIDDTAPYYSMADVFIFPSLYEGMSVALIEAQANGLVIIASDVIPKDSILTNNVHLLSLNLDVANWVDYCLNLSTSRRVSTDNNNLSKYDIKILSSWLENFYVKSVKEMI